MACIAMVDCAPIQAVLQVCWGAAALGVCGILWPSGVQEQAMHAHTSLHSRMLCLPYSQKLDQC